MLPIVGAMQSLQGLLTNLSGGLSSITSSIGGLGSAFSSVFDTLGTIAAGPLGEMEDAINNFAGDLGDGWDSAKEGASEVAGEIGDSIGGAFDTLKGVWGGIFNKKKVEEAIAPVSEFTTAQQVSDAGYADAIIRGKIQEEQLAASASSKQQAADIAAMQRYAESRSKAGTVNVSINAAGITDQTDKRKMARELAAQVQSEMARYNAGLTLRPRL